jgi:TDG/mug DNA glycosylase family protein
MTILPDVLQPGLRVVFCGTAAGTVSAQRGAYYAGPGNRFWPVLYETGLTPHRLQPEEFRTLPRYSLGLTDLAMDTFGADSTLRKDDFDVSALRAKIEHYAPRALAFNGKRAAQEVYGRKTLDYGQQDEPIEGATVFVLPSTSGLATAFWDARWWHELAAWARRSE